jgi:hypothetical protein
LTDPPGAPDAKSATWAVKSDVPAKQPPSNSSVQPAAAAPTDATTSAAANAEAPPQPSPEEREDADFARLEALGMPGELAATILTKLDEAIADLPV